MDDGDHGAYLVIQAGPELPFKVSFKSPEMLVLHKLTFAMWNAWPSHWVTAKWALTAANSRQVVCRSQKADEKGSLKGSVFR